MKYCKIFLFLLLMILDVSNAQEVTCEGEQLINVDIIVGYPTIAPPYKPGQILVFRCTDVNLTMYGQRAIECLSNGKWDNPYPKCGDVTCPLNTKDNNIKMERLVDLEGPIIPGHKLLFSCTGEELTFKGQREIICQPDGEWSSPLPKCVGKCAAPPHVNFADTIEMTKNEYNPGEKVEYKCFNKYTLDKRPSYSNHLICENGEWKGKINCLKPCSVTVDEMDIKGIQSKWGGRRKIFSEHLDYITFACQRGRMRGSERQQCNDGVMTLPECV